MSKKGNKFQFLPQEPKKARKNKFVPTIPGFYNRNPEFSFKYYEHEHAKYSVQCIIDYRDFHIMFEKLKAMSQLKWRNIKQAAHVFHFHPILNWKETSEPHGFKKLSLEMKEFPPWQFKLFKECRAVGFFNQDNIFELVWMDRDHEIYPRQ